MWNDLFNKIAPVYGMFFDYQVKNFRTVLQNAVIKTNIPIHASFLDIGCGTGALSYALSERGFLVTGVDAAPQMIKRAKKRNGINKTAFVVGDALSRLDFDSKSFDVVISSYVAHGMSE